MSAAVLAPEQQALKTYKASEMTAEDLQTATARPRIDFASILSTVIRAATCATCRANWNRDRAGRIQTRISKMI